jgi:outer membrane lipase/esterase
MKKPYVLAAGVICAVQISSALAQPINQLIGIGDSSIDSGWFANTPSGNFGLDYYIAQAVAHGGDGAFTSGGGWTQAQFLAAHFGTTAIPANQPGGTNYANGASLAATDGILLPANIDATTQIADYLASVHGAANPDALYLISTGANDVTNFSSTNFLTQEATNLANSIATLHADGARYILVEAVFAPPPYQLSSVFYGALYSTLAAKGVNFIPFDALTPIVAVITNPAPFGITNVAVGVYGTADTGACKPPPGFSNGWSAGCSPNNLVSPDAANTYLYADNGHLSTAGARIMGDYEYSLVTAPSQISYLPETAITGRRRLIEDIRGQMELSRTSRGAAGLNVWAGGDLSDLRMKAADAAFSGLDPQPLAFSLGADYQVADGVIVGGAFAHAWQNNAYTLGGKYKQTDDTGSLYGAFDNGPLWADAIGSFDGLSYDSHRDVAIGLTTQPNNGNTSGHDLSFSAQGGWHFIQDDITHGPLAGLTWQDVHVGGFTESGSFTSLSFRRQDRRSLVGTLGYQASLNLGVVSPFVSAVWNHEFSDENRQVTTSLTTMVAPSYFMPAVEPGRNWGTPSAGIQVKLSERVSAVASVSGDLGQARVTNYGGQLGLNVAL